MGTRTRAFRFWAIGALILTAITALYWDSGWYKNTGQEPTVSFEIRAVGENLEPRFELRRDKDGQDVIVNRSVVVSHTDVTRVRVVRRYWHDTPEFVLMIDLSHAGAAEFSKLTAQQLRKRVALLLDGAVYFAPVVMEPLSRH